MQNMKRLLVSLSIFILFLAGCQLDASSDVDVPVSDIALSSSSDDIEVGEEFSVSAKAEDGRALGDIRWSISDDGILSIVSEEDHSVTLHAHHAGDVLVRAYEGGTGKEASLSIVISDESSVEKPYGKDVIRNVLMKTDEYGMRVHIAGDWDHPKEGLSFSIEDYRLLIDPREPVSLHLEYEDGRTEENVEWFVESTIFHDPNGMYLFSPEESEADHGEGPYDAWRNSPLIIRGDGKGGMTIEGTLRFDRDEYYPTGSIIAVVDGEYVMRKPFYVLKTRDIENLSRHEEVEEKVRELTVPLMKYGDMEKAYLMDRTVTEHLTYTDGANASEHMYFVEGKAVCEGYSRMFDRMGKELGLDTRYLEGETSAGLHAWNAVRMEDGWYYVDTTWNDSNSSLRYFFMDKDDFEGEAGGYHEERLRGETFGTMYLGENYDYGALISRFMNEELAPDNAVALPDGEKITFIGETSDSGYLRTEEEGLEYNVGDGIWHPLKKGEDNLVSGIRMADGSFFHPDDNTAFIGSPQCILIRRSEGDMHSNYIKVSMFRPARDPRWIEADGDTVRYVNSRMEYRKEGSSVFIPVRGTELKLPSGTYHFRMKGYENYLASDEVTVVIG